MKIIKITQHKIYKFVYSQLWRTEYDDTFQGNLEKIYELDYKYHAIKYSLFDGHPKAKENILKGFEKELRQSINYVSEVLQYVFEDWLSKHALTDPKQWADSRIEIFDEEFSEFSEEQATWNFICSTLNEIRYGNKIRSEYTLSNTCMKTIINEQPELLTEPLERKRQQFIRDEEIDIGGYDEDSEEYKEHSERLNDLKNQNPMEFLENLIDWGYDEKEDFITDLFYVRDLKNILEKFTFPIWYSYWSSKGIDKTRENVEEAYKTIQKIPSMTISEATSAINYVINVSHQSGGMIEHIHDYIEDGGEETMDWNILDKLSNIDTTEWEEELNKDPRIKLGEISYLDLKNIKSYV